MQYLKSATSIHPGTVIKMYAIDKKFYFVPLCNSRRVSIQEALIRNILALMHKGRGSNFQLF